MDILAENIYHFSWLIWTSFNGQFVYPVGGEGVKEEDGGIIILASCEHHFNRVHKNLVQHPSINISISLINNGIKANKSLFLKNIIGEYYILFK